MYLDYQCFILLASGLNFYSLLLLSLLAVVDYLLIILAEGFVHYLPENSKCYTTPYCSFLSQIRVWEKFNSLLRTFIISYHRGCFE